MPILTDGGSGKGPACTAGDVRDMGSIPGLGLSPGGECGNPLQYSCLEDSMDKRAWRAIVHRVAKSWTRLKQLSMYACLLTVGRWYSDVVLTCISPIISDFEHLTCVCWPFYVFFGEMPVSSANILIELFLTLSCMNYLCILEINPLPVALFANTFSQSICYLVFMVFFAVRKLLSFIRFHMFIFDFISIALGVWREKALLQSISDIVLPMSSSRSFLVSCVLFKFKPFWVCVCGSVITSLLCMQLSICLNTTFWRDSFLHCIILLPLSKINWL